MANKYRITPAQEAILDRFTCQRLTDERENNLLVWEFFSRRGRSLTEKLKFDAWQEDLEGVPAAYYVIKAPSGRIAMFFSLKCGTLCDPGYVAQVLEDYKRNEEIIRTLQSMRSYEEAMDYIEEIRSTTSFPVEWSPEDIFEEIRDIYQTKRTLKKEKKSEQSEKILRVDVAFPAIELVHFCVNDLVRDEWESLGLGRGLGETMFWKFVLPKMLEVNRLVGCEYAYLFAADSSRDETLINYYENALHFERPTNIGGIKPTYDFLCTFMCKRLFKLSPFRRMYLDPKLYDDEDRLGLVDYQKDFFDNFNMMPTMD